jgi:hypothetical protein
MKARFFFAFIVLTAAALPLRGQVNITSGQSAAEVEDIGEISEPGVAGVANQGQFRFNAGVRAQYTSNARLSGDHGGGDAIWFPTIEAGYHVGLGRGFAFDSLFRLEAGVYTSNTERTYIGYSLPTTIEWRPKPALPRIFVGVEPYRYDASDSRGLLTEAIGVSAGTDWGYAFDNGRSLFFLGYTFTNYYADPDIDTRNEHSAIVGVTHLIRPRLYAQIFYQYKLIDFDNVNRIDHHEVVGLSFIYQINEHLFGTLTGNFVNNDSTETKASYQSAGASVGVNYHF